MRLNHILASFPGSPAPECKYMGRVWYLFLREHDVIGKGPEFSEWQCLHMVQSTIRSMLGVYDYTSLLARYMQ